jgi:hypothetical protein
MAIKGNAVPDAILFVRAEHFEKVTMMLVQAQHDRQREHDLRVKINNEAETLRDAHRIAVDRHSVTLNELTAARSALTAERTRRGALEAALRSMPCGCITNGRSTIPPQPDDFTHTIQCARCAALSSGKTDGTV